MLLPGINLIVYARAIPGNNSWPATKVAVRKRIGRFLRIPQSPKEEGYNGFDENAENEAAPDGAQADGKRIPGRLLQQCNPGPEEGSIGRFAADVAVEPAQFDGDGYRPLRSGTGQAPRGLATGRSPPSPLPAGAPKPLRHDGDRTYDRGGGPSNSGDHFNECHFGHTPRPGRQIAVR
jgi:hypothetical protein